MGICLKEMGEKYTLGETTCLSKNFVSWPNVWEIFWGRPVWQILPMSPLPHGYGTYQPDSKLPASHQWLAGLFLMPETYFVSAQVRLKMSENWRFTTHKNWSINTPAPSSLNMLIILCHRLNCVLPYKFTCWGPNPSSSECASAWR